MAERQQALAEVILKDPAVESLSSFIGVDGTNTTLNSGRIQINLKPLEEREHQRQRGDPAAAAASWPRSTGITLFMQPVQDLTVEDRVSRTQYQYSLEDPDAEELNDWVPTLVGEAQDSCRELRDVASDQQNQGLQAHAGDRPRHGLAAGHHAADDRRHALRRLRAAPGLDHVHAAQPVPRGAGGQARVPAAAPRP